MKPGTPYFKEMWTQSGTTSGYIKAKSINWSGNFGVIEINGVEYYITEVNTTCVRGYTGAGYGIDRWYIANETILINDGYITIVPSDGSAIQQIFESPDIFWGKTFTFSVLTDTKMMSTTFTLPNTVPSTNTNFGMKDFDGYRIYMRINVPNKLRVDIYTIAGTITPLNLRAAKLELGDHQTLAHQDENGNWVLNEIPDYNEELVKCRLSKADSSDTYANKSLNEAVGAAPVGYGLGERGIRLNSWNDAKANGFYYSDGDAPTSAWWQGFCVVTNPTSCVVHAYQLSTGGITYECRREYTTELGWSPWEWSNPPMSIGIEYRTTERYLGKPVYIKVVDYGEVPTSGWKNIDHGISNMGSCISCIAEVSIGGPLNQTPPIEACYTDLTKIRIKTTAHDAGYYAYVTLKYTKTTD